MPFLALLDMHELDADRFAVGFAHDGNNVPQGRAFGNEPAGVKNRVEIGFAEVEGIKGELRMIDRAGREGVGAGQQVADVAVAVDQGLNGR